MSDCNLLWRDFNIHRSGALTAPPGCYMSDTTSNYCRLLARLVCTMQPCTSLQCHFIRSHIRRAECMCNRPPAFWQNDRDLLQATAVTRGWNGYLNKSQHRKLILDRKAPNQDVSITSHELYHSPYKLT